MGGGCFEGLEWLGLKVGYKLLRRMDKGLDVSLDSNVKGGKNLQVEVDANRIEGGFDGPALGSAALKELIDRDAIVV